MTPRYRLISTISFLAFLLVPTVHAQTAGMCTLGEATRDLDIGNVRARLYNTGGLFFKGAGNVYNIPKAPAGAPLTPNAIFASSIWLGGMVDGVLRMAAANYSKWEFWPGPLTIDGELPGIGDCTLYDRIWEVTRAEINTLDNGGASTTDIDAWPADLGAPFIDANSDGVYNVADGDRPDITGDQMAWWVMNDVGNEHQTTGTPPMGMEVQVSAFVYNIPGDLANATFYRYKLVYKGKAPMTNVWFGNWTDPDLGHATDDYVGSDTTLGLGFVYNGDNDDEGSEGYGTAPPALGYTYFQGPLVDADGIDNNHDGTVDEEGERLKMTRFLYYNGDSGDFGNPRDLTDDWYNYVRGIWKDGSKMCFGGNGFNPTNCEKTTDFMWPGDPVTGAFWSDRNIDNMGTANPPSDRRFVMSTGPFTMNPGDTQELFVGIITGFGADNLDSITKMREATRNITAFFDTGVVPPPPPAPTESPEPLAPGDGATGQPINPTFQWESIPGNLTFDVELATNTDFMNAILLGSPRNSHSVTADSLMAHATYYWHVRATNQSVPGPWSPTWSFATSDVELKPGGVLEIDPGDYAFIEVAGPDDRYACGVNAISTFGCDEVGGNFLYPSFNGAGTYVMSSQGTGPEGSLNGFAPDDFEIRFTEPGSYGYHSFTTGKAIWVPFEVWDIGPTGPFGTNDPADDVQLIPVLFSDYGGECEWAYGELPSPFFGSGTNGATDRIYAYFPTDDYAAWEAAIKPLVDADPNACPAAPATDDASNLIDFGRGRPLQRIIFDDATGDPAVTHPAFGVVVRFLTVAEPPPPSRPSAPADRDVSLPTDVTLWWSSASSARLQVATDRALTQIIVDSTGIDTNHFDLTGLDVGASYYWRLSPAGLDSWSATWAFTVGTSVAVEREDGLPQTFELQPNYPNPFRTSTTLRFGVPKAAEVRLAVYDVLGRRVASLAPGHYAPGWYAVQWQGTGLGSGVYFVRMEAGGKVLTRSVTLMR